MLSSWAEHRFASPAAWGHEWGPHWVLPVVLISKLSRADQASWPGGAIGSAHEEQTSGRYVYWGLLQGETSPLPP